MTAVDTYQLRVTHLWTGHRASEEAAQIKLVADAALAELGGRLLDTAELYEHTRARAEKAEAALAEVVPYIQSELEEATSAGTAEHIRIIIAGVARILARHDAEVKP